MLLLAAGVPGWVTISQARFGGQISAIARQFQGLSTNSDPNVQQKMGYLWSFPEDADDTSGLGGGITWQWDPKLCDGIIDKFDEDFFFIPFIQCSDLKASMHRAFASWSDNHKDINFVEVTEECKAIGQDYEGCELAELWITALAKPALVVATGPGLPPPPPPPPELGSGEDGGRRLQEGDGGFPVNPATGDFLAINPTLHAEAGDSSAATASPNARISTNFRYTNGMRPYTLTPGKAAFKPEDATRVTDNVVKRVGRQVALLDGKVDGYVVTWISAVPRLETDYVAAVSMDGAVGGNVTLLGGGMFVNPTGKQPVQVIETFGATISFNTELCWYLDSTFCSYFHALKNVEGYSAAMVLLVLQVILFSIFSLAALIDGFQLFRIVSSTACHGGGCLDKLKHVMDEIAKCGIVGLTFRLVCLWTPPISYGYLFLPCWNCFDFEGAATHEVGHVLGLSHPDTAGVEVCSAAYCAKNADGTPKGGQNSFATALNGKDAAGNWMPVRMNNTNGCELPWDTVREFPGPEGTDVAAEMGWTLDPTTGVRDTIMEAFTQHNPSVCLTYDDLEALNVNYPQCDYAISEPVCYKTEYYIGWIRLGVWVGLPIIIMLIMITLLSASVRRHQFKRMGSMHKLVKEKSGHLKVARNQAQRASCEAAQLAEALDMQIATEESRIQERAHRMSVQMVNDHLTQLQEEQSSYDSGARGSCKRGSATSSSKPSSLQGGASGGSVAPPARGGLQRAGSSFLKRMTSGSSITSDQPAARKWLGGAGGALGGSLKKVGSALGMQKQSSVDPPVASSLEGGQSTDPPNNLINVPDQYRLNPIRGSQGDPDRATSSADEIEMTIEERLKKESSGASSGQGESSQEEIELNTTDRTRTMHKGNQGNAAQGAAGDRGSCTSLQETSHECDTAVQISVCGDSFSQPPRPI